MINNELFSFKKNNLYFPFQPYCALYGATFRNHILDQSDPLSSIVSEFYEIENAGTTQEYMPMLPDGCNEIMICCNGRNVQAFFSVSIRSLRKFIFEKNCYIFGIRFMPGRSYSLVRDTLHENKNKPIPLDQMFSSASSFIYQLVGAKSFEEKELIARCFIIGKILKDNGQLRLIDYCTDRIISSNGACTLNTLSEETGYSVRYINKIFVQHVGNSPKELSQIIRLRNAVTLINNTVGLNLAQIAALAGYTDQSHMSRGFLTFLFHQPNEIKIDVRMNWQISDIQTTCFL